MIRELLLAAALATLSAGERDGVDVVRYELQVLLRGADLAVTTTLHATGRPSKEWQLDLVPEMRVVSAESDGAAVPFSSSGSVLTLDLGAVSVKEGGFAVTIRCEGAPSERFSPSHGGYVRSVVGPETTYIRSQVAWYPRVKDDVAAYEVTVDAPSDRPVRSAGAFEPPSVKGERAIWNFRASSPLDRVGLAAGPWKLLSAASSDALVLPAHEKNADGLLALTREALEFYALDIGALARPRFALVEMPAEFGTGSGYSEYGYFLLGPQAFEDGAGASWVKGFLAHEAAHQWWGMEGLFSDFASECLSEYSMQRFLRSTEGEEAALRARRKAIENVVAAAASGKELALGSIQGWGSGLDPAVYEAHAYNKAPLLLCMVESSIGREAMTKLLARFFVEARSRRVGWKDLRAALCAESSGARTLIEQWEQPGIPRVSETHESRKSGKTWRVSGKVTQSGTAKPFVMTVPVVAFCGSERFETQVKLVGSQAAFTLQTPSEPETVIVDPDWQVLVARDVGDSDPKKILESAMNVANDSKESNPEVLARAIADLRGLLAKSALSEGEIGAAHTGIGRCLFRQGKLEDAEKELKEALRLGAGGPFHRGWAHLRLGCIADLREDRKSALEHYQAVLDAPGSSKSAVEKAAAFLKKPYRGYATDG